MSRSLFPYVENVTYIFPANVSPSFHTVIHYAPPGADAPKVYNVSLVYSVAERQFFRTMADITEEWDPRALAPDRKYEVCDNSSGAATPEQLAAAERIAFWVEFGAQGG